MKRRFLLIMLLMAMFAPLAMQAQGLMKAPGIALQATQRASQTRDAGWLQYDNNTAYSMIGSSSASEWTWGVMFPSRMLGTNNTLTKVAMFEYTYNTGDITINVYSGGDDAPGTLLYTETVAGLGAYGLDEVTLAQEVTFDPDQNLWITLTETGTYVMLYCQPETVDPNGQWVEYNGSWYNIADLGSSFSTAVWMIRGYVEYNEPSSCPKPTNLAASDITPNTAVLSWHSSDEVRGWQLAYDTDENFNPDRNPIDVNDNPYTLTGLTDATTYYAYVRANCGDSYSAWSSITSFTTPSLCDAPFNVSVSNITPASANISWRGWQDTYSLTYQIPTFFEDFNDGIPSDWTTIDADGDGNNWVTGQVGGIDDTYCATSASYSGSPLTPDNWLVTPQIALQGNMHVWVRAQDPAWPQEHFAIYLSNGGNTVNDFTTTLVGETVATGEYVEYTADLSSYNGQMGYIAIRHFNCTDMFRLNVDNFLIAEGGATISNITSPYTLTGLSQDTQYFVQIQGNCPNGTTGWSNGVIFTTPSNCEVPSALEAINVTGNAATLGWTGYQNSFNVHYRPIAYGEVIESQDFENSSMGNWTTIDADGDGYNWVLGSAVGGVYLAEGSSLAGGGNNESEDLVVSGSYSNVTGVGALTPDNYLVSPQVELGGRIIFWACGQDASYVSEHFGVAVSTRGNTDAANFVTIKEWTMTSKGAGAKTSVTRSGSRAQGTWYQFIADLSEFEGQGYVAIRHFDCTDMFMLDVDDIVIEGPATETYDWIPATANENGIDLTGLTPETDYEWQVQGVNASCDNGVTEWSESAFFTTTSLCVTPTNLTVSEVTTNSAVVAWESEATSFEMEVNGDDPFEVTNPYTLTNLDPHTLYSVRVRTNCGENGYSDWATIEFMTECGAYDLPYAYGFDDVVYEVSDMDCWTGGSFNNENSIGFYYRDADAGDIMLRFSSYEQILDTINESYMQVLISPELNTEAAINVQFEYKCAYFEATDEYEEYTSTEYFTIGYSSTTNSISAFTWDWDNYVEANTADWTTISRNVPAGTKYVAVLYLSEFMYWLYVDNFIFTETSTSDTQETALNTGWNWFSTYIEVEDAVDMLQAIEESLGENGIMIKNSDGYSENDPDWGWFGDLDEEGIYNEQMYKILVSGPCTVTLEGTPANPANHPITINPGWNWIGFPCSVTMSVDDAFAGFAQDGDKIRNSDGETPYDADWEMWLGDIETLEPGQGYMYYSESSSTRTLVFPTGAKTRSIANFGSLNKPTKTISKVSEGRKASKN